MIVRMVCILLFSLTNYHSNHLELQLHKLLHIYRTQYIFLYQHIYHCFYILKMARGREEERSAISSFSTKYFLCRYIYFKHFL